MDQNGTPPPSTKQLRFSSPMALAAFMQFDRAVMDLNAASGQMKFLGQDGAAAFFEAKANEMAAARDEHLRRDQSTILLASPGDVPPPRLQ